MHGSVDQQRSAFTLFSTSITGFKVFYGRLKAVSRELAAKGEQTITGSHFDCGGKWVARGKEKLKLSPFQLQMIGFDANFAGSLDFHFDVDV